MTSFKTFESFYIEGIEQNIGMLTHIDFFIYKENSIISWAFEIIPN